MAQPRIPITFNGVDFAERALASFGSKVRDGVLTRKGDRGKISNKTDIDSVDFTEDATVSAPETYNIKGFVQDKRVVQNGTVNTTFQTTLYILNASLPIIPEINDLVTMDGRKYIIREIMTDPARALSICTVS